MDIEKLVRMANQIAANSDYGPDKEKLAATVADHLTRFWTPEMRAAVIEGHKRKILDVSKIDMSTTLFGQRIDWPYFCSPTALQRLFHHEGEAATARAAHASGTIFSLSSISSTNIE